MSVWSRRPHAGPAVVLALVAGLLVAPAEAASAGPLLSAASHFAAIEPAPAPAPRRTDIVVRPPAGTVTPPPARGPAATTRVTTVLVILAYWGSAHVNVTTARAKSVVIDRSNAWYRTASYGHQGLTGTATPWLHLAPQQCGSFGIFAAAEAAARARGYAVSAYQRIVVYESCSQGLTTGVAEIGGTRVILFASGLDLSTAVHEQGHNYGLDHANELTCTRYSRPVTYGPGGTCQLDEYSDYTSAMGLDIYGDRYAGDFTAPQKTQLGWLSGHLATVTGSAVVTLAPYETTTGYKAIRIPGSWSGRTYWVEFRTSRGNDTYLPAADKGVILHASLSEYGSSGRSSLLDAVPSGTDIGAGQWALPVGSNWTTPEGIRIGVSAQSWTGATVRITRGTVARVPTATSSVTATALDGSAVVRFARAGDGGKVIRYYVVTARPSGVQRRVHWFTATSAQAVFTGLTNGVAYSFAVQAVNELGTGGARASSGVVPIARYPGLSIASPLAGASVRGVVPIDFTAVPNSVTHSPIHLAVVAVDGNDVYQYVDTAHAVYQLDTGLWFTGPGTHTLRVTATDRNGRAVARTVTVHVTATSGPAITVTSPTAGGQLSGLAPITGTVAPYGSATIASVDVLLDGSYLDSPAVSGTGTWQVSWSPDYYAAGGHVLTVTAQDSAGRISTVTRSFTLVHAAPTLSITSPTSGSSVAGSIDFLGTVANRSGTDGLYVEVDVDGAYWDTVYPTTPAASSDPFDYPFDLTSLTNGPHTFTFTPTDNVNSAGTSVSLDLEVSGN